MKGSKIGFDLDGVFINLPPFIPNYIIDGLYKGFYAFKKPSEKNELIYRYPGKIEKLIRIFSHYPIFRKPIAANINGLERLNRKRDHNIYLISSRFKFLDKKTQKLLEKYKLHDLFTEIYTNKEDEQPHLFKQKMIKKLKITKYIDDDFDLANYLARNIPSLQVYWLKDERYRYGKIPSNLTPIKDLNEFIKKYL